MWGGGGFAKRLSWDMLTRGQARPLHVWHAARESSRNNRTCHRPRPSPSRMPRPRDRCEPPKRLFGGSGEGGCGGVAGTEHSNEDNVRENTESRPHGQCGSLQGYRQQVSLGGQ